MNIPLSIPHIEQEEIDEVVAVLKSGWLAHGPKVKQFELDFAAYIGVPYASSQNSCASALQLAMEASGITGEVILPSMTMSASANAIVRAGARPVFVDVNPDTFTIDPDKVVTAITKQTSAIMPVHFAGLACNMQAIQKIAREHHLTIIEDAAESLGAMIRDKKVGSYGIGCFSFYPTKNITTGEGGMVTTNDLELKQRIDVLKAHGVSKSAYERESKRMQWERDSVVAGYNFRMCDIQAALGLVQLRKVDRMNQARIDLAGYYRKRLSSIPGIVFQQVPAGYRHVYQMLVVKLDESRMKRRDKIVMKLREQGVGASVHFDPPVHTQTYYRKLPGAARNLPVTEKLCKQIVTLPIYPDLAKTQIDEIADLLTTMLA